MKCGIISVNIFHLLVASVSMWSYAESAARLLYQVYCELVLPIPAELEHLRTPDSNDNELSVPLPSVDTAMSYQSSSTDAGQTRATRDRPRYVTVFCTTFCIVVIDYYSVATLLAMQSTVLATAIPSFFPSVTRWYCTQINEDRIMWSSLWGSKNTLFFNTNNGWGATSPST